MKNVAATLKTTITESRQTDDELKLKRNNIFVSVQIIYFGRNFELNYFSNSFFFFSRNDPHTLANHGLRNFFFNL